MMKLKFVPSVQGDLHLINNTVYSHLTKANTAKNSVNYHYNNDRYNFFAKIDLYERKEIAKRQKHTFANTEASSDSKAAELEQPKRGSLRR